MTRFSFLLRMWQVPINNDFAWRILLENVQTGEKRGFASTEKLFSYLTKEIMQVDKSSGEGSHTEVQG
jgi:hypothetical protein